MALTLISADPARLLAAIKSAIDAKEIETWNYDQDGDFTHTRPQYEAKAWLHPVISSEGLRLTTIPPNNSPITWEIYGVYMGRFAEMAIVHFNALFSTASSTAAPAPDDRVGT